MIFFWKDIWHITMAFSRGIIRRKPLESLHARLGWLVVVATIPAGMAGLLLKNIVQSMFADPFLQAGIRLLMTALLLTGVEFLDHRNRHLDSANWLDALSVGLFQVLAVFPGASRSGTTIAGGMVRGFSRPEAARFAFLMSGPILLLAGLYESVNVIRMPGTTEFLPYLVTGFVSAAVVGWLAIKWLISYLGRHSLYIFGAYCAVVGVIVLLFKFS
jgi:undecaprenyl-diphosphatase